MPVVAVSPGVHEAAAASQDGAVAIAAVVLAPEAGAAHLEPGQPAREPLRVEAGLLRRDLSPSPPPGR